MHKKNMTLLFQRRLLFSVMGVVLGVAMNGACMYAASELDDQYVDEVLHLRYPYHYNNPFDALDKTGPQAYCRQYAEVMLEQIALSEGRTIPSASKESRVYITRFGKNLSDCISKAHTLFSAREHLASPAMERRNATLRDLESLQEAVNKLTTAVEKQSNMQADPVTSHVEKRLGEARLDAEINEPSRFKNPFSKERDRIQCHNITKNFLRQFSLDPLKVHPPIRGSMGFALLEDLKKCIAQEYALLPAEERLSNNQFVKSDKRIELERFEKEVETFGGALELADELNKNA